MALSFQERAQSGDGALGRNSDDSYSILVFGTVADGINDPGKVQLFACQQFSVISELGNVIENVEREKIPGANAWIVTAKYKDPTANKQTGDASFSFTSGGGTQHISTSKQTLQMVCAEGSELAVNGDAPNFNGNINVTDQGVGGVDIEIPTFDFKTTFYVAPSDMIALAPELKTAPKRVNSDVVTMNVDGLSFTFQPGELFLREYSGSKRVGYGDFELSLNWSATPNIVSQYIGPSGAGFPNVTKNGWDYLWVWSTDTVVTSGGTKFLVKTPQALYVERVYDYQEMSGILPTISFGLSNSQPWLLGANFPSSNIGGL